MFICIPILFGCQTKLKPEGDQQLARICPRCGNASVIAAKSTTWFEFFWVPIFPFSKKHLWLCTICQWQALITEAEPNTVGRGAYPPNLYSTQPGYAPGYIQK